MCVKQCGNHAVDDREACDDGNDITEACAYGDMDCSVCGPDAGIACSWCLSSGVLNFTNNTFTGEMCILDAEMVGSTCN